MNDIVIKAENLGKSYMIGHQSKERYVALRDILTNKAKEWWSRIRNPQYHTHRDVEEFWALKDVSFEVKHGETLGIIGRNGAGKSTLLKVLSRITEPTTGRIRVKGRVASLLEVGTGFHPELTGRENIYLNGAILGMTRREVKRKFDEIVAFAEVEKFIDTPVKRYSSGMYVRLAFAVAAHLEPEILLVDEVLAVGDVEFQKKCLGKMGDVAKEGRTVLFVSHNMLAVKNLCSRAILLDEGRLVCFENVSSTVERYLAVERDSNGEVVWNSQESAPGNHQVRLRAVRVVSDNRTNGSPPVNEDIEIQIDYWNLEANGRRLISVHVLNAMALILLTSSNMKSATIVPDPWLEKKYPIGLFRTKCIIPKFLLNPGQHSIDLYINGRMASDNIILRKNIIFFNVQEANEMRKDYQGKWIGAVRPILHWETTQLEEDIPES